MLLSEIASGYSSNIPAGIVLDETEIKRQLKNAVRFFSGYSTIQSQITETEIIEVDATNSIDNDQDFNLTDSEYSVIYPLFRLYMERENAIHIEASRSLGVEAFGRQVSEINADIAQKEMDIPRLSFYEEILSV